MLIVTYRKVFYAISAVIVVCALAATIAWGINPGIDFTGGTSVEVSYASSTRPAASELDGPLTNIGIANYSLRPSGENEYFLETQTVSDQARKALPAAFSVNGKYPTTIVALDQVGPTIGNELAQKAWLALVLVLLAIVCFITFAFRSVSRPVSSWVYGLIALIALAHDVVVPVGFFAAMSHFFGIQADALFVTAILTILGFSVHDTIVVFDRVRENLRKAEPKQARERFEMIAGTSLNQTFTRSVNTSLTVAVSLLALFFLGPVSTQDFALTLLIGIIAGTYSSIALATPLLVTVAGYLDRKK
ncbi:MAG TPA: protein translocase subunit SecF [Candidatus Paceibacterota bacterium]|nr:protein translocase subunit SecF [Candidatus Paceibacterota bacterium]